MPPTKNKTCKSFNTQPPEGGWKWRPQKTKWQNGFNTQPPEGGWITNCFMLVIRLVSTHSRLKAAGVSRAVSACGNFAVSTHSRLKAAGQTGRRHIQKIESFNTQPPEGGWRSTEPYSCGHCRFNTQPPEGGWVSVSAYRIWQGKFQHTAA